MKYLRILTALVSLSVPASMYAASLKGYGFNCDAFLFCDNASFLGSAAELIVTAISIFIIPLATLVFLYGAILMITSQGEERKESGKKAMMYAALGLVLAILAWRIILFVQGLLYSA